MLFLGNNEGKCVLTNFTSDTFLILLKVKGFQVAPAELEGCLLGHPDVENACVVGVPDDYSSSLSLTLSPSFPNPCRITGGEMPMAFIVPRSGLANQVAHTPSVLEDIKESVMKHVADNKVAYKHLAGGVEVVDVIPMSPSGKLLRRVVREKARELRATRF